MKLPVLLLTSLLVSAALGSGAALAEGAGGSVWNAAPVADAYGSNPGGGFVDSYGDHYLPLDRIPPSADVYGSYWDPGAPPAQFDEFSYSGDYGAPRGPDPIGSYPSGAGPEAVLPGFGAYQGGPYSAPGGYLPQGDSDLRAFIQQSYGIELPPRTVNGSPAHGDLSPGRRPAYRFRGDDRLGNGVRGGAEVGGWQFRPLTEQERSRTQSSDQWRPARAVPRPQARPRSDNHELAPRNEAFGYEPDNWFRRYYGDRP